jgi:hypothetical protein
MTYLISVALVLSLAGNWYYYRKAKNFDNLVTTLKSEIVVLEKMYDDLSKEYNDFVDFVDKEEQKIQDQAGINLLKQLEEEIMSEALRLIKPVYEA